MKRFVATLLAIIVGISAFFLPSGLSIETDAASTRTKAINAYNAFLKKQTSSQRFALAYINNDNIPELIVDNKNGSHLTGFTSLYAFNGKKMVKMDGYLDVKTSFPYYKKGNVFLDDDSVQFALTTGYYTFNGKKRVLCASKTVYSHPSNYGKVVYYVKTKKVSKTKYTNYIKKLSKGKKLSKAKMVKNTSANRKKYVK